MNKLVKGAVATAAGVALLMGGAGTFALWNTSQIAPAGTVASGTLTVALNGSGTWRDISADRTAANIPAIASWKIVPGDKLELSQTVTVNATGDNLKATLSYDDASIKGTLKSLVVVGMNATGGSSVSEIGATDTFAVTPSASATTVTITVTVDFPSYRETGQAGSLDLSTLAFKLAQNPRP